MAGSRQTPILETYLHDLSVAVVIISRQNGIIEYANRRVYADLKRPEGSLPGKSIQEVFWPEFLPVYNQLLKDCEDGKEHSIVYYWAEKITWEQVTARKVDWQGEPSLQLCVTFIEDTALKKYSFECMIHFDSLLNLPNGDRLEEDINQLASLETVALLYFEVERFEEINDLYGWDNGDYLLLQVRDWLQKSETRRAQLYRVNNGFAILGRGVTMDDARSRCREILQRFGQPWLLPTAGTQLAVYCTIRIGVVFGKYVRNEMRNLLMRTIRATQVSEEGYSIYDEATDQQTRQQVRLRNMLIYSIFNQMQGFSVQYQPIVDAYNFRWIAVEALCRYTTPDGTSVSPLQFIHLAEQIGLIDNLDYWVRKTAMQQCVSLGLHEKDFYLDLNFSTTQSINDSFINELYRTIDETGFPAEKLNLEVTESTRMTFDESNIAGLKRLQERGIVLALDDFGTGYSSFENLIKISARTIKTEKLFLDGIENDSYRQYLLRMIVDLAHHLGMSIIAEGVETTSQLALLQSYEVDYIQGYYFSRPLTYQQLKEQLFRFDSPDSP